MICELDQISFILKAIQTQNSLNILDEFVG